MKNTKEEILKTALKLFAQNGFDSVSVSDIANVLEISKSAMYRHYENKKALFDSVVKRMEEDDLKRSKLFDLPNCKQEMLEFKNKTELLDKLILFALAQFDYWINDEFASSFRKIITIEQFKNEEMKKMFSQYFSFGPLSYVEEILSVCLKDRANSKSLALEFYSPLYLSYGATDEQKESIFCELKNYYKEFKLKHKNEFLEV